MKKWKILVAGLAILSAGAAYALHGDKYLAYTNVDTSFCKKMAYYHMTDAKFMMVKSAVASEVLWHELRFLHLNEHNKWARSDVRCLFGSKSETPGKPSFLWGVEVNGEMLPSSERDRVESLALRWKDYQ